MREYRSIITEIQKYLILCLFRSLNQNTLTGILQELELYEEFTSVCGDVYTQIFLEWTAQNGLKF